MNLFVVSEFPVAHVIVTLDFVNILGNFVAVKTIYSCGLANEPEILQHVNNVNTTTHSGWQHVVRLQDWGIDIGEASNV
jgi:hypothetical protein